MHQLIHGDCLEVMRDLEADSFDAVVCDPPYHLTQASRRLGERGFMGATWDGGDISFRPETWAAALRVTKPGGRLLAFGGTRTFHRIACAIEDAGWVLEDVLCWLTGQGFPKHKSKLKPAWEPVLMAWKPARHATPLQIDACRVAAPSGVARGGGPGGHRNPCYMSEADPRTDRAAEHPAGRWPANLVLQHHFACVPCGTRRVKVPGGPVVVKETAPGGYHGLPSSKPGRRVNKGGPDGTEVVAAYRCVEDCPVRLLDEQAGRRCGTHGGGVNRQSRARRSGYGLTAGTCVRDAGGGPSRFFYCSKASRKDRGAGNTHCCVKPHKLMKWLVRLVTPPGGHVLDPFAGSGSTGLACAAEGLRFTGIERERAYVKIARKRLAAATPTPNTKAAA